MKAFGAQRDATVPPSLKFFLRPPSPQVRSKIIRRLRDGGGKPGDSGSGEVSGIPRAVPRFISVPLFGLSEGDELPEQPREATILPASPLPRPP